MKDSKQGIVIRAVDPDGVYWYYKLDKYSKWTRSFSDGLIIVQKAMSDNDYEKLFEAANLNIAEDNISLQDVEMLDIAIGWCKSKKISADNANLIKQKIALSKLTREDIESLGIQDQAALHRLSDNINVSTPSKKNGLELSEISDHNEPSMDDILGSIRRMLSEDEDTTTPPTFQKKTITNRLTKKKQQSQRVLNQDEINSLLGFDEDISVTSTPPKNKPFVNDTQDAMAAAWEASMGGKDDEDDDLAAEWAAMLDVD